MTISGKREALILLFGDVIIFSISLWLMLFLRWLNPPSWAFFKQHLIPFMLLFGVWIVVYFIAGLYGKHTLVLKKKLPHIIFNAQLGNVIIAAIFFFLVPYFGIAPKTTLFIYLLVSFPLVLWWRLSGQAIVLSKEPESAILIGSGKEVVELKDEVNNNPKYGFRFDYYIDLERTDVANFKGEILSNIYSENISVIVVDIKNEKIEPILPHLYNLLFANVKFIDLHKVYEEIFDRVPLSFLRHTWFLENISISPKIVYESVKRIMDITISAVLGILSLAFYPFIILAIKIDDGGVIFSYQNRVGQHNKIVRIMKFRTMTVASDDGKWGSVQNQVTRVGAFLRRTRLDELPQLWNVLHGDLSLIGPRPEFPDPVERYSKEIPFYNVRHLLKPGLSGWAQIHHDKHPHHGLDIEETRNKLSYDLYYVKNQSFLTDLYITLRTIETLLSRSGK